MSYCRFGWDGSQVYVFGTVRDGTEGFECCGCLLEPERDFFVDDWRPMVNHLLRHRETGHTVPQYAIDRLEGREVVEDFVAQMRRNPQMFGKTQEEMDELVEHTIEAQRLKEKEQ